MADKIDRLQELDRCLDALDFLARRLATRSKKPHSPKTTVLMREALADLHPPEHTVSDSGVIRALRRA